MCGIAGIFTLDSVGECERNAVKGMTRRLTHRGPDSEGFFESDHVVLAMRRLAIIDLSGGGQPLFNEEKTIALVCNGEIYNHEELRSNLQASGHIFSSNSDVETIIHAYEEEGIQCLERLHGMFAFALWDARAQKLLLARDRLGEKPLYFHKSASTIFFSSEIRSLQSASTAHADLTPEAFNLFLTFQYIPEPHTPLKGFEVLPAGCFIEFETSIVEPEPTSYWNMSQLREDPSDPIGVTKESLENACRLMGKADVPVAISLSGGIDSSLVAALTARHQAGKQLHAFTIGYQNRPETDERLFAEKLAKELDIAFTEIELDTLDVAINFPKMVAAMDTPIGDIAAYGYYMVCSAARQAGFPVLLSGLGGDEFFWGYEWVRNAVADNELWQSKQSGVFGRLRHWLGRTSKQPPDFFGPHEFMRISDKSSRSLMSPGLRASLPDDYWLRETRLDPTLPPFLAVSELLNRTWLRSNCLALMDRMSMAHSVEVRLPMLDVELVNRVTGMRNSGLEDWKEPHKWLLIESLKGILPPEILQRKKQGFTPPFTNWIRAITTRFYPLLKNGALTRRKLLVPEALSSIGKNFDDAFLYRLILLECWARLHLEGSSVEELVDFTQVASDC